MFDTVFGGEAPAALLAAIEQDAQIEARAHARTLAAIAELLDSTVADDEERGGWAFDGWSNAAAGCPRSRRWR